MDFSHILSTIKKAKGHIGNKKSLVEKGTELNDRNKNGVCIDAIISTICTRNTKSGALSSVPSGKGTTSSENIKGQIKHENQFILLDSRKLEKHREVGRVTNLSLNLFLSEGSKKRYLKYFPTNHREA